MLLRRSRPGGRAPIVVAGEEREPSG